jgi:hypothetical protein
MHDEHHIPAIKSAQFDLSRFKVVKGNRGSARGEVLDMFLNRLNPSRVAAGYKPLSHSRLAVMLAHIKQVDELHAFYRQCDQAGIPFSAFFHWSLKPTNQSKETKK